MDSIDSPALQTSVLTIPRSDRWQVSQRLQELHISTHCLPNGQLRIEIHHPIDILQLRSVIQQHTAARADLINWVERCWQHPGKPTSDR